MVALLRVSLTALTPPPEYAAGPRALLNKHNKTLTTIFVLLFSTYCNLDLELTSRGLEVSSNVSRTAEVNLLYWFP